MKASVVTSHAIEASKGHMRVMMIGATNRIESPLTLLTKLLVLTMKLLGKEFFSKWQMK